MGTLLTKQQMKSMFEIYEKQSGISQQEQKFLKSVLEFSNERVESVFTKLQDTFMLDAGLKLDIELMRQIYEKGYSRVPVYEGKRENIIGFLMTKDLVFVNFEKIQKLWQLTGIFLREVIIVCHDAKLNDTLQIFRS